MNAQALTTVAPETRAAQLLSFDETKAELTSLAKQSERITQITNKAGRDECHSSLMVLKGRRVDIQKRGKEARDDANKFAKAVIAKENELIGFIAPEEERLQLLRDQWDTAIEVERLQKLEAERQRVETLLAKIGAIRNVPAGLVGKPSVIIAGQLAKLEAETLDEDEFAEHFATARDALDAAIARVKQQLVDQKAQEAEAKKIAAEREELERMRAENARLQQEAEARAAADRAEADRKAQAERERIAAEEKAKRDAEQAAREAEEAAAKAERDRLDAIERERLAQEQAARDEAARVERERIAAERAEQQAALQAERERQASEQKKLDEQAAKLKREQQAAKAEAERVRLAGLGLREAVEAVITYFSAKPDAPQCVLDLQAALVNDIRTNDATEAKPARAKRAK